MGDSNSILPLLMLSDDSLDFKSFFLYSNMLKQGKSKMNLISKLRKKSYFRKNNYRKSMNYLIKRIFKIVIRIPILNFLLCYQCFWCPMTHRKNLHPPIRWWWCSWCSRWEILQLESIIFCHFWWWVINPTMIRCFWKGLKIIRLDFKFSRQN